MLTMDPWTPERRNAFIDRAVNSEELHGEEKPYHFNVLPKMESALEVEDAKRGQVTEVLANVLFENPEYRKLSLQFYELLTRKMMGHPMLCYHMTSNIVVLIKGSIAHAYLMTPEKYRESFNFSDLDISVCINPTLDIDIFNDIKSQVEIVVKQSISQFKRTLDHMLFLNKQIDTAFISNDVITEFKEKYTIALEDVTVDDDHQYASPFESDSVRNDCSRTSFLIVNSKAHENSVVRIEVPHFDKCERIPLRKTPLFCSFNETINFVRDGIEKMGKFNLYRLRMNNVFVTFDKEGKLEKKEKVACDFIDVSVPDIEDAELINFWNNGRCINVYDKFANMWMLIPDIDTCISELERILTEYECPENKKMKRENKLNCLKKLKQDLTTC